MIQYWQIFTNNTSLLIQISFLSLCVYSSSKRRYKVYKNYTIIIYKYIRKKSPLRIGFHLKIYSIFFIQWLQWKKFLKTNNHMVKNSSNRRMKNLIAIQTHRLVWSRYSWISSSSASGGKSPKRRWTFCVFGKFRSRVSPEEVSCLTPWWTSAGWHLAYFYNPSL